MISNMITEFLILVMFSLHLQLTPIINYLIYYNTLSSAIIVNNLNYSGYHQLIRLITSNLFHLSLNHLIINMIAFINFGIPIEDFLTSYNKYLYPKVLLLLMILSGIFSTLLHYIAYLISGNNYFYQVNYCGFSAVLFGLQFMFFFFNSNDFSSSLKQVIAHMIYIYLMVPNSSFFGHLGGILSGVTVIKLLGL